MLVGREPELRGLLALVDQADKGAAGSLVMRGEPGVGKSALLEELAHAAGDATVLRTQGLEVEAPLAFAALHRLLRPLDRLRDGLPEPQARALRVVFGEEEGQAVEPFLVGVATLSLLTTAAEQSLVLCVVDDAHWLDPATAEALLFSARRLGADRVAMVFGVRDGTWSSFNPQGLAEMLVTGLGPDDSRVLLTQRLGAEPPDEVVDRMVIETGGNPLALLELPEELTSDQLSGLAPLPTQLHLTANVEQVFLDRSQRLPPSVQSILLVAAANDTGDLDILERAASRLGLDNDDLSAGLESGLLVRDATGVSVRHPLVRSAVYQAATAEQRRAAHLALANALEGRGESDRETWHRAFAADGADNEVVDALEAVGDRAQSRGGHVAALAAYERAAALCDNPARRAELTFAAARSAWACGRAGQAQVLLSAAREVVSDPVVLADIARLRGHIEVNLGSAAEAHRIFVDAAQEVFEHDRSRALDLAVVAAVMRTFGADSGTTLPVTDALVAEEAGDPPRTRCLRHLLASMTQVADGDWAAATRSLNLALEVGENVDDRDVLWNLGNAALQLGDDEGQQRFYGYALARAREAGAVTAVIYCLQRLCFGYYVSGDLAAVRSSAEEAISLGASIGQPSMTALPVAWLTLLAALQDTDDFQDQMARLEQLHDDHSLGILSDPVHDVTRWARAARSTTSSDPAGALHHLSCFRMPVLARMAALERIDAAVRADDEPAAKQATEELVGFADSTGRYWALATVAFGRALTASSDEAETSFEASLTNHRHATRRLDAARTELAYGEWLRRRQRRVDARKHLRNALDIFQDARVASWTARANQELRASGETARKRNPSTLVKLTPTELQIARLVSSGLSNKEVAAQCWVSPRTVAFHLRNIFAKAGITSRGELAQIDLG